MNFPRAEPEVPNLPSGREKMCIAVDIPWPGSHRKVPTCLVYNEVGNFVAWGQEALSIRLCTGWTRCEMFKLHLDSASGTNLEDPFHTIPEGKEPMDLLVDYLRCLWEDAKRWILENGFMEEDLKSADIWLSIPTTWRVQSGEIMREAASRAGLVGPRGSRDRLQIIPESEAAGVHCVLWENFLSNRANPSWSVMLEVVPSILPSSKWGLKPKSATESCTIGGGCGSQFLDVQFRYTWNSGIKPEIFD
ncbi:hypothetical protein BS47DRAFT_522697 [Hydnum rufescens UP504]|uniref:Uncharacterized protein n=1 Tax=Hydnum rufescens UP504 TaxID=1448309 RepID=A0A9P6B4U5_9AGAM|nr:hypothetical protein BS47DRAFT_522697 [Hydnum rufescens UP504]